MNIIKTTSEFKNLFEIDANIHRLVRNIEVLNYINPLNIAAERKKFFTNKYNYEPYFKELISLLKQLSEDQKTIISLLEKTDS